MLAGLQVVGPTLLFAALAAAETAAYALSVLPTSQALWSLNLRLFDIFQKSHYIVSSYCSIPYFQLVCIGIPVVLTSYYGLIRKRQFPLALASSLSFLYVLLLAYAWYAQSWEHGVFSLANIPLRPDVWLAGVLAGASLLSVVVSHMSYLSACKAEGDGAELFLFRGGPDRRRDRPVLRGLQ
jgi:hypothetical protein